MSGLKPSRIAILFCVIVALTPTIAKAAGFTAVAPKNTFIIEPKIEQSCCF